MACLCNHEMLPQCGSNGTRLESNSQGKNTLYIYIYNLINYSYRESMACCVLTMYSMEMYVICFRHLNAKLTKLQSGWRWTYLLRIHRLACPNEKEVSWWTCGLPQETTKHGEAQRATHDRHSRWATRAAARESFAHCRNRIDHHHPPTTHISHHHTCV